MRLPCPNPVLDTSRVTLTRSGNLGGIWIVAFGSAASPNAGTWNPPPYPREGGRATSGMDEIYNISGTNRWRVRMAAGAGRQVTGLEIDGVAGVRNADDDLGQTPNEQGNHVYAYGFTVAGKTVTRESTTYTVKIGFSDGTFQMFRGGG